jgi:hypothetical protein
VRNVRTPEVFRRLDELKSVGAEDAHLEADLFLIAQLLLAADGQVTPADAARFVEAWDAVPKVWDAKAPHVDVTQGSNGANW